MKRNIRLTTLSATESSKLVGGFSAAFSLDAIQDSTKKVNNCQGGNFKAGCGAADSAKVHKPSNAPNKNCKGNCVKGCGGKK